MKLNSTYQIIQFDYVVILGFEQPVRVTFLGRVGLEESQNVLGNVANDSGREFAISTQLWKLFCFDKLVLYNKKCKVK